MKIGLWKRIVLGFKLLLGMEVIEDVRLLLVGEIQPLKDIIVCRAATIASQQERLRDLMMTSAEQLAASSAARDELSAQLEDLESSIQTKIATVERHAAQEKATALVEKEKVMLERLQMTENDFVRREETMRAEHEALIVTTRRELLAEQDVKLGEQRAQDENLLHAVLFDLRGGNGEDDRYSPARAYEFCKNLSPQSCKSLRHIIKIETRLTDAENTIRLHLRSPDDTSSSDLAVKRRLPVVE